MNLLSILGKVGGTIIENVVPGGSLIVDVVNEFLPDDKKLAKSATGQQAQDAIATLPADVQAQVLAKEFDVQIEEIRAHVDVTKALGEVDKTGHSTRPAIAKGMAQIVGFTVIVMISCLAVAIWRSDEQTINAIGDNWPLILAILGTPTALLRAYFGMRTREKQQKYQALSNTPPTSAIGSILGLFGKGK